MSGFPRTSGGGGGGASTLDPFLLAASPGPVDALPNSATITSVHGAGTLASRPAAAATNEGFYWFATDTAQWYRSNGATWIAQTPLGTDTTKLAIANNLSDVANANTAFANISPMTTNGDLISRVAGVPARLGIGTAWQALGTDGTVPVWSGRARTLLAVTHQAAVGSVTTTASLIGGFQNALALGELAIGDVLHFRAGARMVNNSGGSANMSIQVQMKCPGSAASTLEQTTIIAVATAATTREVYYDLWLTPSSLTGGGVVVMDGAFLSNVSAAGAVALVVANSQAQSVLAAGCGNVAVNGPYQFDLQVVTNVNNAATTGQCIGFMVEKISL